jgi:hypothetical protein
MSLSRSAAIRISPKLWLELTSGRKKEYGQSDRVLDENEVRRLLAMVQKDRDSEILSSSAVLATVWHNASIDDRTELLVPETWGQHIVGKHEFWLPEFHEWRETGISLHAERGPAKTWSDPTRQLKLEYSELEKWIPCGPVIGMPQFRIARFPEVITERGKYLLLGSGSTANEPFIIWLVAADAVNWW